MYKYAVEGLTSPERERELKQAVRAIVGVTQVDTNLEKQVFRIVGAPTLSEKEVRDTLEARGFRIRAMHVPPSASTEQTIVTVGIDGMTCRSCEITIERKWKKFSGVKKIQVDAAAGKATFHIAGTPPTIAALQQALGDHTYLVHDPAQPSKSGTMPPAQRPTFLQLVGLFALVFVIGYILEKLGLFKSGFTVSAGMGFGAIFLVGLLAASSSCIAVVGGLLLSSAAKYNARYGSARPLVRMRPAVLFVSGRIVGYTIFGGLLGVIGGILTPSPFVTALITMLAAVYMLVMGLDMLHIAPTWMKKIMPRMPKRLSHRIMDAEGKEHPATPFALGAATFFLPCGFTQGLQLYALTTGSFGASAMLLLAFALGTAPALLVLGYASGSVRGKAGQFFFRFSGALVIVLGLWNMQNGLTIAGYPLQFPAFAVASATQNGQSEDSNVVVEGNTQVVKMAIGYAGYEPNQFTLKAGMPVRWEVDGTNAGGCTSVLMSRQLGIQKLLEPGTNVFEFTPKEPGKIAFNCSMGMVGGSFTVVP